MEFLKCFFTGKTVSNDSVTGGLPPPGAGPAAAWQGPEPFMHRGTSRFLICAGKISRQSPGENKFIKAWDSDAKERPFEIGSEGMLGTAAIVIAPLGVAKYMPEVRGVCSKSQGGVPSPETLSVFYRQ